MRRIRPKNLYVTVEDGAVQFIALNRDDARTGRLPGEKLIQIPLTATQTSKIVNAVNSNQQVNS